MTSSGPEASDVRRRYWAFLSYSWADKRLARSLHRRFERFAIPRPIRPLLRAAGPSTRRLRPVFRDDDEMPASGALDDRLRSAIDASAAMVLLASPTAATSRYVDEEVAHFVATRGTDRLAILTLGGDRRRSPALPAALRATGQELLWVDCRGDTRLDRRGLVRVVATVLGIDFDLLWRRHRRRRRRVVACWTVAAVALAALFGAALWQQRVAEQRTPQRQQALFESYLAQDLLAKNRAVNPTIAPADVRFTILRGDDLNNDGLIDFFVSNESPGFCGSGGCALEVYVTRSPGEYTLALSLLGSSTPRARDRPNGTKEIVATDYQVSREPLYSVYRLAGQQYALAQYEFCDGLIFEMCQPTVIAPLPSGGGLSLAAGAVIRERPDVSARPVTIGAGESGVTPTSPEVIGVLANGQWYLVDAWKKSAGFVPAQDIVR